MAVKRTISTRLVMEGEKEYRSAIKQIGQEYRTLDSELKLVESKYKDQQNTLAALEAKHKALNDVIAKQTEKLNAEKTALSQMQDLQKKYADAAEASRKKLEDLARNTDDATKETKEYKDEVKAIQQEIAKYEKAEQNAADKVEQHTQKINKAQIGLNDLNSELAANEKHLDEARSSTDGCAKSIDAYGKEVKDATGETEEFGKKGKESVDALAAALAAAGIVATVKQIADALLACVDSSIAFESAMAGVAKTTDMTDSELVAMGDAIKEMATRIPLTTTELAQIAETAGQLGVAKGDLLAFTEVMAALGVSTNMTSEEAATMLAQFANVTGMDTAYYSNLGSAIVDLGNNFATNAKIGETDILGMATAVTSLGIEAGTGGNNMSKLISEMQLAVETGEGLDTWAKAAGMSAKEFATLWGTDATSALVSFIGNLNHTDEAAVVLLDSLGLNEMQMRKMITSLANAEDQQGLLSRAIQTSNKAWNENTALTNEAAQRYGTTESKIQLFRNSVDNLKVAIGDELNPAISSWVDTGTDVVQWAEDLVKTNPELVHLITALISAAAGFIGVATALAVVSKAWAALQPMLATNPWILAAAAIAGVAAAILSIVSSAGEADEDLQALQETAENVAKSIKDANDAYEQDTSKIEATASIAQGYIDKLKAIEEQSILTNEDQRAYAMTLEKLQLLIPGLNVELDEQTGLLKDGTAAIQSQVDAWKEMQRMEAVMEHRSELMKAQVAAEVALDEAQKKQQENAEEISKWEDARNNTLQQQIELLGITAEQLEGMDDTQVRNLIDAFAAILPEEDMAKFNELSQYLGAVDGSLESAAENGEALGGVTGDLQGIVEDTTEAVAAYDEQMGLVAGHTEDATQATNDYAAASAEFVTNAEAVKENLDALMEAYQASYETAYENLTGTMGLFTEMSTETERTVEQMITALDSQLVYMDQYAAYIEQATALGIDEGLLAKLMDGSTESFEILAALVNATDEQLQAFKEKFGAAEEAKDELAGDMAAAKTAVSTELGEAGTAVDEFIKKLNQQDAANTNTAATMQGVITAMETAKSTIGGQVAEINAMLASLGAAEASLQARAAAGASDGSHAAGLGYVPYDEYTAKLHKGEMVLTALAAKAYRAERFANYAIPSQIGDSISHSNMAIYGGITVVMPAGSGGEGSGREVAAALRRELRYRGGNVNG